MVELNPLGEYYKLIRLCGCGSGLPSSWCKNEKQTDVKACDRCKGELLHKIFEEKLTDFFLNWIDNLLSDDNLGYEWVWEDYLAEKKLERIKELEKAKQKLSTDQFLVRDPFDKESFILVPKDYAETVLQNGKMI
jgi:hypothetical protein